MPLISTLLLAIGCGIILAALAQAYTAGQTLARSRQQSKRLIRIASALAFAGAVLTSLSGWV